MGLCYDYDLTQEQLAERVAEREAQRIAYRNATCEHCRRKNGDHTIDEIFTCAWPTIYNRAPRGY